VTEVVAQTLRLIFCCLVCCILGAFRFPAAARLLFSYLNLSHANKSLAGGTKKKKKTSQLIEHWVLEGMKLQSFQGVLE
jgi:hypothetical protein